MDQQLLCHVFNVTQTRNIIVCSFYIYTLHIPILYRLKSFSKLAYVRIYVCRNYMVQWSIDILVDLDYLIDGRIQDSTNVLCHIIEIVYPFAFDKFLPLKTTECLATAKQWVLVYLLQLRKSQKEKPWVRTTP